MFAVPVEGLFNLSSRDLSSPFVEFPQRGGFVNAAAANTAALTFQVPPDQIFCVNTIYLDARSTDAAERITRLAVSVNPATSGYLLMNWESPAFLRGDNAVAVSNIADKVLTNLNLWLSAGTVIQAAMVKNAAVGNAQLTARFYGLMIPRGNTTTFA
jgi:hypothetical protein